MSNPDERLERIENQVKVLLERQRLSRFDNLMFLVYPLVIFGITLSFTMSLQYGVIKNTLIWGAPLLPVLEQLRFVFVVFLGSAFLLFCLAYARDNVRLRLTSLGSLVWALFCTTSVLGLLLSSQIMLPDMFAIRWVQVIILLSCILALFYLTLEGADRLLGRVAQWFKNSIPITLKEAQVQLDMLREPIKHRSRVKVLWSIGLVVYSVTLGVAAWRGQLTGRNVYDSLYVAAFLIVTEAIMLWRL